MGRLLKYENANVTTLTVGSRVSYGDMANPRTTYVVVGDAGDVTAGGVTYSLGSGGGMTMNTPDYPVVNIETYAKGTVSVSSIDGPGGWCLEDGPIDTAEYVAELIAKSESRLNTALANREAADELRAKRVEIGKALYEELAPAGTKAVIVANYDVDDCDLMSDYHGSKRTDTLVLGYSKHTRNLFGEMRKVAAASPYADKLDNIIEAGKAAEHRENYSFGGGMYLKDGNRYSTGWSIRKENVNYGMESVYIALAKANAGN